MRHSQRLMSTISILALAASPAFAQSVGVTAAVNQKATGSRPVRTISLGGNIIHNEQITTDQAGLVQILLKDGTAFTVSPKSQITVDSFVYDPNAGTAKVAATLSKGIFRFVGGKTSKTPNGVTLNTPVGTVGVRGAVVDLDLSGSGLTTSRSGCPYPQHVDFIFGDEMTVTGAGRPPQRVYKPGYSVVTDPTGRDRNSRTVVKTPPECVSQIQLALSGRPGTHGGSTRHPTDAIVVASGIAETNSNVTPPFNHPPTPTPRPEPPLDADRPVIAGASQDELRQDAIDEQNGTGGGPQTIPVRVLTAGATYGPFSNPGASQDELRQDAIDGQNGTGGGPQTIPVRVLTAGATYGPFSNPGASQDELRQDAIDGQNGTGGGPQTIPVRVLTAGATYGPFSNPGAIGLVGGSAETDEVANLQVQAGTTTGTGAISKGTLTLPIYDDDHFSSHPIAAASGATLAGQPLTGTAYSGVDGFTAYVLAIDGDHSQPLYGVRGTPVQNVGVFGNGDIRTYSFTRDMMQDLPVPFMRAAALGTDYSSATISPFYVAEPANGTSDPTVFQAWLSIKGSGADQTSGVGISVGALSANTSGSLSIDYGRRGSYRSGSTQPSSFLSGAISSISAPGGGNEIFGSNGQNLVLSADSEILDFLSDSPANGSGYENFSTLHVLDLEKEQSQQDFLTGQATTRVLGESKLLGYAAGTVEIHSPTSTATGGGNLVSRPATSEAELSNMQVAFDRQRNSVGGEIQLDSPYGDSSLRVAFGDGINGNGSYGPSSYIDDDKYAAARNKNPARTYIDSNNGNNSTRYYQKEGTNNRTYFVSGDAVPQTTLLPNGRLCDCKFLEWGWWGTQIRAVDAASGTEVAESSVHLGTWVAGDVSTLAQVDAAVTSNMTATFSGNAVGNVINGNANYIASGSMDMQWNFGSRTGDMQIGHFDGRNFAGPLNLPNGSNVYEGFISEASDGAAGAIHGAFVNDGANTLAGTIGNFNLETSGGAWSATGVFAGQRTGSGTGTNN
ncbi:FecR domain-containing protein [Jiella sp. M17.18]|uniref:FecR family protein n=1 Tax=Jiella sp. M17.18 TaxID=3234247 RepID=UPI0034DDE5B0